MPNMPKKNTTDEAKAGNQKRKTPLTKDLKVPDAKTNKIKGGPMPPVGRGL